MQITVSLTIDLPATGDIDAVEPILLDAGRRVMAEALVGACREYESAASSCPHCGSALLQREGSDRRVVFASFGRVELQLRQLRCEHCGRRFRPAERFLAPLEGANITAHLKEVAVLAGASWPYATAAFVLGKLSGARISPESIRQLTGGAGAEEMRRQVGRAKQVVTPTGRDVRHDRERTLAGSAEGAGRGPDLLMVGLDGGWVPSREQPGGMEGKVGVVASDVESIGRGKRRLSRRRYVATFGESERLGLMAYAAADELGAEQAQRQVVLGDGAGWIKTEAGLHFPEAVKILDWPHVERAVHRAIRAARPGRGRREERRALHQRVPERLWHGDVAGALDDLIALRPAEGQDQVKALEEAISYLRGQRDWLGDYAAWRDEGYPVGSGLVERAVELVLNRRLKGWGMRWRRANADAVAALRVHTLNQEWDDRLAA